MYFFSIYEFQEKWAEMSEQEHTNFLILVGVSLFIIIVLGILEQIKNKKKENK